ncbi:hypothetical protein OROGR_003051 [Orobanche gracilis]
MNIFRFAGDMTHLISILVLLLKIYATKSCSGISVKTQELYAVVFLARYLDLFTDFISVYNTIMKLVFIGSSLAIVWCMRFHRIVRRSYDRELDTFRHYFLVGISFLLALFVHEKFSIQEFYILGIFNIPGGGCNSTTVGPIAKKWKCGQSDWTICHLSWELIEHSTSSIGYTDISRRTISLDGFLVPLASSKQLFMQTSSIITLSA